jgi:glycosyltransferase involved in cell wall biosynthesis
MRILQVNKFFYLKGGSERYFFDLCDLLEDRGHEVGHFSMQHPRNRPSYQSPYFVSSIDLNAPMNLIDGARAALRILYSSEAKRKIGDLLDTFKPDIVHFHNITRQISPSVVDAVRRRSIPMVQTLHDLSLVCPAHSFFVDGRPCEDCAGGAYWHAIPKKCIDGFLRSSLLGAAEAYLHSWIGIYGKIRRFIAPSLFLKSKVSSIGWVASKTVHLPYFIPPAPDYTARNDHYVLFAGRISREKGVGNLIEGAARLKSIRFVIAGEGPQLADYRDYVTRSGLSNVEFVGYAQGGTLERLLEGCSCVVVPSRSYENLPLSILEAFARGKPVVASDCGGIPELVKDGVTGYVFRPDDPVSLAEAIAELTSEESHRAEMGRHARDLAGTDYSPGFHYEKLLKIYEEAQR